MREIRLRHHHLLCTQTFTGKGYDHRFVANMKEVVSSIGSLEDLVVRLSISCDDICSCCPNVLDGICENEISVRGKDRRTALFLDLPEETLVPAGPLMERARERLSGLLDIRQLCGECEWAEMCNERLRKIRGE